MSIYKPHLKNLITKTLTELDLYSKSAVNLLLGTCAQESLGGTYLKQLGSGPALGIFQMEPETHDDICINFIIHRNMMRSEILRVSHMKGLTADCLEYNICYAICMARIHYFRVPHPLPEYDNIEGLAAYWKKYYNTNLGSGTEEEFIKNYHEYVLG